MVRKVFEYLREHVDTDVGSAHLLIDGTSVTLAYGDQLADVLKTGQGTVHVISLSVGREELEADLASDETSED